jgi:hypothetical protein
MRNLRDKKAKPPGAHFEICLPLADIERLSEDFVSAKYGEITQCATSAPWKIRTVSING